MPSLQLTKKLDTNDPTPLYYQLYRALLSRIESGEFSEGSMLPTEKEVGEEYGVSRITVIKAMDILELEGHIQRQQGRGTFVVIKSEESKNGAIPAQSVALICHALSHPYLAGILVGVATILARNGISLQVFGSVDSSKSETQSVQRALDRDISGLIVLPWADFQNLDLYRNLAARELPLVMVDRYYPSLDVDHVVFDDWHAGFELTARLIQRGHRKIAFTIADEILPTSVHERLAGYKAALEEHELAYDENLVWVDMSARDQNLKEHILQSSIDARLIQNLCNEQPTGLVAVNYDVAEFLLYNLHTMSLDSSITDGWLKEIEIASVSHKSEPTNAPYVRVLAMQSGELLGSQAAELLVGRILHTLPSLPQKIKLPMTIVEMNLNRMVAS